MFAKENSRMGEEKVISILIVEDNATDAELAIEALQHGKLSNDINLVTDGEQAMQYLRNEAPYENAERPDLILLDLNLPKIDGREVLKLIRADEDLSLIPVVILTVSKADQDILESYGLYASNYIVKPISCENLFELVRSINNFWLRIVALPPKPKTVEKNDLVSDDG